MAEFKRVNQQEQEPQRGIEEILNPKTNTDTTKEEIAPNSEMDACMKIYKNTFFILVDEIYKGKCHDKDGKLLSPHHIVENGGKLAKTTYGRFSVDIAN